MRIKKIKLPFSAKKTILALGPQNKNTVCLIKKQFAYLGPIHQRLDDPKDFLSFEKDVRFFLRQKPKIIAHDLHPDYQSTKYAIQLRSLFAARRSMPAALCAIQHHQAHIAACMAENGIINRKVIGVAFDGTGLGADNKLWGAEFLICDYASFKRAAHLKEIPLLGGERAIIEPWRLLAAWTGIAPDKKKMRVFKEMLKGGINCPLAGSMGRLFDAAGCLLFKKGKADFEAELAIALEKKAACQFAGLPGSRPTGYKFKIISSGDTYILDPAPVFEQMTADLRKRIAREKIAYRFHLTIAKMIEKICQILRKKSRINRVVLSGGVFQNQLLLELSMGLLSQAGFEVFKHKNLSCGDANISLGQAVVANFLLRASEAGAPLNKN